jgi:ribosomal-protein-alanine N-acetyltransferase
MAALEVVTDDRMRADWRTGLPVLTGQLVTLRELQSADAPALYAALCRPEVARSTWPPPASVDAFERFIEWAWAERATGKYICYGIVPRGREHAVGLFELRQLQPGFFRGELGFLMDPDKWGTGLFSEGAVLLLEFAFQVVEVHRIEARAAVNNPRSNAALRKIGARQEGTLRAAFVCEGQYIDQNLWAILSDRALTRASYPSGAMAHVRI